MKKKRIERGLLMKNITSAPNTRLEKRQSIKLRNKKLVAVAGSTIGLLVILCAAYLITKDFNNHEPKTDAAATKTIDQSKSKNEATKKSMNPTEKIGDERSNLSSSEYILPDSDKKVLSEENIADLSKEQLRLARNEIYARHGYVFKSADLQKYFSNKSWYQTDTSYNGSLSEVEKENVKLLEAREAHM